MYTYKGGRVRGMNTVDSRWTRTPQARNPGLHRWVKYPEICPTWAKSAVARMANISKKNSPTSKQAPFSESDLACAIQQVDLPTHIVPLCVPGAYLTRVLVNIALLVHLLLPATKNAEVL